MAHIRSYTVVFFTDTARPGYLFADIYDELQSDPILFFQEQFGHSEEHSCHSCKQVHVHENDYVKAYRMDSDEYIVFASENDADVYCDLKDDLFIPFRWSHYILIKDDQEIVKKPQFMGALHGQELFDALEKADEPNTQWDIIVKSGWVTASGIPLFGLAYNEMCSFKLQQQLDDQEDELEIHSIEGMSNPDHFFDNVLTLTGDHDKYIFSFSSYHDMSCWQETSVLQEARSQGCDISDELYQELFDFIMGGEVDAEVSSEFTLDKESPFFNEKIKEIGANNPELADSCLKQGEQLKELGSNQEALSQANLAIESNPSYEAYSLRGTIKDNLGDYVGAIKDYTMCFKYYETLDQYSLAFLKRGLVWRSWGYYQRAISDLSMAIDKSENIDRAGLFKIRSQLYLLTDDWEKAEAETDLDIAMDDFYWTVPVPDIVNSGREEQD